MTKKWVPTDYIDEVTPQARDNPNDWLADVDGGKGLASCWGDEDDGDEGPSRPLTDGEAVKFDWVEMFGGGTIDVSYNEDGQETVICRPEMPKDPHNGSMFVMLKGEPDSVQDDAYAIAKECGPGTHEVVYYAWSYKSVPFTFSNGGFVATPDQE